MTYLWYYNLVYQNAVPLITVEKSRVMLNNNAFLFNKTTFSAFKIDKASFDDEDQTTIYPLFKRDGLGHNVHALEPLGNFLSNKDYDLLVSKNNTGIDVVLLPSSETPELNPNIALSPSQMQVFKKSYLLFNLPLATKALTKSLRALGEQVNKLSIILPAASKETTLLLKRAAKQLKANE